MRQLKIERLEIWDENGHRSLTNEDISLLIELAEAARAAIPV